MIPIAKPWITESEVQGVADVVRSGNIAQGKKVQEFEEKFAEYIGVKHAIATSNGTTALHAAMASFGVDHNKHREVLVPSFSFFSTASCVNMVGATPVFVDINPHDYTIDVQDMYRKLNHNTIGVIGVHLFGLPFDIYNVKKFCKENDLFLIEDAAQAAGASYRKGLVGGGMCGSFGDMGCFSFYATKNMTTGEGGIITTDDDQKSEFVRKFINHGQSSKYNHDFIGYNFRMTDMQAALGVGQLKRLGEMNAKRIAIASYYNSKIRDDLGLVKPYRQHQGDMDFNPVYHQYVLRVTDKFPMDRGVFVRYLNENKIGTAIHYPKPIHMQEMYEGMMWNYAMRNSSLCPVSEMIADNILSIPVHPLLSWEEVDHIVKVINESC